MLFFRRKNSHDKKRLAWLTDIHLDRLTEDELEAWISTLHFEEIDGFLITGDISNSQKLTGHLKKLAESLNKKIYFVLGNHDFYESNVTTVKNTTMALCEQHPNLQYLPTQIYIDLDSETALVGQDTWADARLGDFNNSTLLWRINDPKKIGELKKTKTIEELKQTMQRLADTDAALLRMQIEAAIRAQKSKIVIACHVPPFAEVCQGEEHEDEPKDYLPFFASKATGDMISSLAKEYPTREFIVFCGHTHVKMEYKKNNLHVFCGELHYRAPKIQGIYDTHLGFQEIQVPQKNKCVIL